jgi:two-component system, cell cycle sensor histidine kinase and response regulator CckA
VLFLSGYTEDAVVTQGASGPASAFLQKPFTLQSLAKKVREVLRSRPAPKAIAKSAST